MKRWPKFFLNKAGQLTLIETPNWPFKTFFILAGVSFLIPDAQIQYACRLVAMVAMSYWSLLEIFDGDSSFRRAYGATVFVIIASVFFSGVIKP